jgi:hypothetical protein
MLLNKINVLDKGYVALMSTSNDGDLLHKISVELLKKNLDQNLYALSSMTLVIKCPLFVQLNLMKFNFNVVDLPVDSLEAFTPDITDVGGQNLEVAHDIADDLKRTQDALLINPAAYQKDGCDRFISQVNSPVSVYNEIIISGPLANWLKFARQNNLPKPVKAYADAVKGIIINEWKKLQV